MKKVSNVVVLTCPTISDILNRTAHTFADATFLYSPKYYYQFTTKKDFL